MIIIKDPIHGYIELSELEEKVVDTADFQRLRRIKQLAMSYLIYPGATHTRFEHSLGTMKVAGEICPRLEIPDEMREKIRLAALLHDIGHVAFSHESERSLSAHLGTHEEMGELKVSTGEIGDVLRENYNPREIIEVGKGLGGHIIGGDVGADRMDYLERDAYHTGVAYGVIDAQRLIHTLVLEGGELCVDESGLAAAESLLIGRFLMFSTVYFHKTVRIASAMLNRAISLAISSGGITAGEFLDKGDEEVLLMLRECKESKPYAEALMERRFYKQACAIRSDALENPEKMEEELSEECGCEVLVDLPITPSPLRGFGVRNSRGVKSIFEVSDLVSALLSTEEKRKKTIVMCPAEKRGKVAERAEAYCTK